MKIIEYLEAHLEAEAVERAEKELLKKYDNISIANVVTQPNRYPDVAEDFEKIKRVERNLIVADLLVLLQQKGIISI